MTQLRHSSGTSSSPRGDGSPDRHDHLRRRGSERLPARRGRCRHDLRGRRRRRRRAHERRRHGRRRARDHRRDAARGRDCDPERGRDDPIHAGPGLLRARDLHVHGLGRPGLVHGDGIRDGAGRERRSGRGRGLGVRRRGRDDRGRRTPERLGGSGQRGRSGVDRRATDPASAWFSSGAPVRARGVPACGELLRA